MATKPKSFDVISSGTLRDSDLLRAMVDTLKHYRPKKFADLIEEGEAVLEKFGDFGYVGYLLLDATNKPASETNEILGIEWLIHEELWEAMNDIAPAGTSFCSHPDWDGVLFGFWPEEDSDLWE